MRRLVWLVLLALAAGAVGALRVRAQDPAPPEAPAPPAKPAPAPMTDLEKLWWMAGTWEGDLFKARFQEHWMRPRGGVMLGTGRLIRDGQAVFTEFLRIRQEGGEILYTVWPGERGPTTYTLTSLKYEPERKLGHAVFTNPEHQRRAASAGAGREVAATGVALAAA
ncbi:MAG: DUF6265 family protein [Planctomycetota bacterium]|jgi:hypothetical protein